MEMEDVNHQRRPQQEEIVSTDFIFHPIEQYEWENDVFWGKYDEKDSDDE